MQTVPATIKPIPITQPTTGAAKLSKCLDAAGIVNVDGANPGALRKAAQVGGLAWGSGSVRGKARLLGGNPLLVHWGQQS